MEKCTEEFLLKIFMFWIEYFYSSLAAYLMLYEYFIPFRLKLRIDSFFSLEFDSGKWHLTGVKQFCGTWKNTEIWVEKCAHEFKIKGCTVICCKYNF